MGCCGEGRPWMDSEEYLQAQAEMIPAEKPEKPATDRLRDDESV